MKPAGTYRGRRPALLLLAAAWSLSCGCPSTDTFSAGVPDEVSIVGLVVVDNEDDFIDGSALAPWTDSLTVVERPGSLTMLVGYTTEQVAPYVDILTDQRLRAATGCQNRLPTPSFAAYLSAGQLVLVDPAMVPPMTTDVVEATCPDMPTAQWAVDATCQGAKCDPGVELTAPCTVRLDLTGCEAGRVDVTVDAAGRACAVQVDGPEVCTPAADDYADASLQCTIGESSCRTHIYREARARTAPFTVTRTQWKNGANATPTVLGGRAWIAARYLRSGYAFDMALLSDQLVVTGPLDVGLGCTNRPFELTFFDLDTLQATSSVTTRACAQAIAADPGGETFVMAYLDGDSWRVGRFDRNGAELVGAVAVDQQLAGLRESNGILVPNWRPEALLLSPEGNEVWLVMYDSRGFEPLPGAAVIRLDATTLTPVEQRILPNWHRSYSGAALAGTEYVLLAEWSYSVGWFRTNRSAADAQVQLQLDSPIKNVHYTLTPLTDERVLVAALGQSPAIVLDRSGESARLSHPAGEAEQMMVQFLEWGGGLKLGIGLQTINAGRREAIATLLDPSGSRFLPGVWVLGDGLATRAVTDPRGRHFVVLPWTAELLRIDPR